MRTWTEPVHSCTTCHYRAGPARLEVETKLQGHHPCCCCLALQPRDQPCTMACSRRRWICQSSRNCCWLASAAACKSTTARATVVKKLLGILGVSCMACDQWCHQQPCRDCSAAKAAPVKQLPQHTWDATLGGGQHTVNRAARELCLKLSQLCMLKVLVLPILLLHVLCKGIGVSTMVGLACMLAARRSASASSFSSTVIASAAAAASCRQAREPGSSRMITCG